MQEARGLATLVAVSIHAHEQGATKENPAEFLQAAAHQLIDAGADLVIGHGPHLLRGLELYHGKPVFYSLGNFIGQNELVERIPADGYERFRADPSLTPGAVYQHRTANDTGGFPADPRYWESVMPILTYDGGALAGIELHPLSLGFGEARYPAWPPPPGGRRGRRIHPVPLRRPFAAVRHPDADRTHGHRHA